MALPEGGAPSAVLALLALLFMNIVLENLLEPRLVGTG
jgi:predicted PurR-regulated permease PerM